MAQWVRTLVALSENRVQFPALTWQFTATCNSSSGNSAAFLATRHIYGTSTHMQTKYLLLKNKV